VNYITTKEAAAKWGISDRRVLQYCHAGRIAEAEKMGNTWLIPKNAEKPADGRTNPERAMKK
jgi:excisionase family DNA binding protein